MISSETEDAKRVKMKTKVRSLSRVLIISAIEAVGVRIRISFGDYYTFTKVISILNFPSSLYDIATNLFFLA